MLTYQFNSMTNYELFLADLDEKIGEDVLVYHYDPEELMISLDEDMVKEEPMILQMAQELGGVPVVH